MPRALPATRKKLDGSVQFAGGYNVLAFGDFYHIPQTPSSASLATPPIHKKTEGAKQSLDMMRTDGEYSLNCFVELTIQKRIDDPWYASVME